MEQDELATTLRQLCATQAQIEQALLNKQINTDSLDETDGPPEVQPGNVLIVELFFKCCRYWHRAGMEAWAMYLDPQAMQAKAMQLSWFIGLNNELAQRVWDGIEVMELTCLKVWREEQDKD